MYPTPQWSPLLVSGMTTSQVVHRYSTRGPQWSPLLVSGMTMMRLEQQGVEYYAAMEPALGERDDGSRKTSLLTWEDTGAREQSPDQGCFPFLYGLVKVHIWPLTWARALPGTRRSTKALALRQ